MKTKRILTAVLAALLILSLFAGCGGSTNNSGSSGTNTGKTDSSSNSGKTDSGTADSGKTDSGTETGDTGTDTAEDSPYHLAAGNYELNAEGFPTQKYVYDKPLCDTDEVFTKWTTCYTPQWLPEDGYNGIRTWMEMEEYTGVHIEYDIVASDSRSQQFGVLLASDDLDDIIDQGWYMYSGTYDEALEEGYFADLYEYREYMPNYMYETWSRSQSNPDVMPLVFYHDTHIVTLWGMVIDPVPSMGYMLRQDWMDELGLGSSRDVTTFDELHDVLLAMKTQYSTTKEIYPYFVYNSIEVTPGYAFCGYNTAVYTTAMSYYRVVDGEVQFCGTTEDDRAVMTMLNQWYNEGLISPNYQSFETGDGANDGHKNDEIGCYPNTPGSVAADEATSVDPDTRWEPIPRTKLYDGQILEYGNKRTETHYGSANLNAKCENMELLVSWMDWWFSDFGAEFTSWGPEGWMWEYNEDGEKQLTDWIMNHEGGMMWMMIMYANNNLLEFCLHDIRRSYAFPEGKRTLSMYDCWIMDDYGGSYDWPSNVTFTSEQLDESNQIFADLNTFFAENYTMFVNGEKPMSEWDAYIEELNTFGYERVREIYQEAYDAYVGA